MRVIVLGGCGEMGTEATRDLARTSEFEEIVVADVNLPKARALAEELGGGRVRAERVDAGDEQSLSERLRGFDVVANCTTYHFGLTAARAGSTGRGERSPRRVRLLPLGRAVAGSARHGAGRVQPRPSSLLLARGRVRRSPRLLRREAGSVRRAGRGGRGLLRAALGDAH